MTSVVAIRHVHFEDLGTIEPLLVERGHTVRYVDATVENLAALDALAPALLVFLGGPIGAFDEALYPFVADELKLVQRRLSSKRPTLGICLGAQMMARAMGAAVAPMGVKEIGFSPLDLTDAGRHSALADIGEVPVLHWHGDQFAIPAGASRLAASPVCPNQAFSVENFALGLQFHAEADLALIERWLVGHANELHQAGIDPRALREAAREHRHALKHAIRAIISRWLDQAGLPNTRH